MKTTIHGGGCGDSCCLRVQNLSVKIGNDDILRDVNLHVHCGQMVALIGPNGAGKSTFLKAVLGQREYEGIIAFSAPGMRHRHKPRIGYVPAAHPTNSTLLAPRNPPHHTTQRVARQRSNALAACRRYASVFNPRLRSDSDGRGIS